MSQPQPPRDGAHRRVPTRVRELASAVPGARWAGEDGDPVIRDVTHDSRQSGPGVLFACRPGRRSDGHDFAPGAVAAGSPALLLERPLDLPVPQLVTDSVAAALGPVAAAVHGHPASDLRLVGVTGTNGKTTTCYLVEAILRAGGHSTGLIGTVETLLAGRAVAGVRTTPEATDLQRLLRRMRDEGVTAVAMEVSSHGLALGRVRGTRFAAAAFTNLTQDHLDFHRDLEDYFRAKAALFSGEYAALGVVNIDDPYGARLAASAPIEVVRLSVAGAAGADVSASRVDSGPGGSRFTARLRAGEVDVSIRLPGHYNVANALTALALAEVLGIDPQAGVAGLAGLSGVPGRMEPVDAGQPFGVVVDYAHTPDSLANVLEAARRLTRGKVVVVLGCGGDRDRVKRPIMGRVAVEHADAAVFTNDNPRSEDPQAILDAIVAGAAGVPGARYEVVPARREAIATALDAAAHGDVVVIAGKGHETYQELADRTVPFDDRAVARELLGQRSGEGTAVRR